VNAEACHDRWRVPEVKCSMFKLSKPTDIV
jgi:hypothetical protein